MNITPEQLRTQHDRALALWPWIHQVEREHGLPPHLLCAVGSRETNLRNIQGDYSKRAGEATARYHGYGVWQRDAQHGIPATWMDDVRAQAEWSAALLEHNFGQCKTWRGACSRYNSGQCLDAYTTGRDYGADVMARQAWLVDHDPITGGVLMALTDKQQDDLARRVENIEGAVARLDPEVFDAMKALSADIRAIKAKVGA